MPEGWKGHFGRLADVATWVVVAFIAWRLLLPRPSESLAGVARQAIVPGGKVTLVEIGATYCPPCWGMKPTLLALEKVFGERIRVLRYDIDVEGDRPEAERIGELVGLRATPTMLVTDAQGRVTARFVGATSYAALDLALRGALARKGRTG